MDQIPDDIFRQIVCLLSGKDIVKISIANKELARMTSNIYPWLRRALSNNPLHTTLLNYSPIKNEKILSLNTVQIRKNTQTPLFGYDASLTTYTDIEYWSKVCFDERLNRQNGIHTAIRNRLVLREHTLLPNNEITITKEQNMVVNRSPQKQLMLVQAYAGTGKTTTLYHYANKWKSQKILYLAYNRALADESKERFGHLPNVSVMTIHSLALNNVEAGLSVGNLKWSDISRDETEMESSKRTLVDFEIYCSSDSMELPESNDVRQLWNKMFVEKSIDVTHDAYLKEYQKSAPMLNEYDVIMLDEVQDCTDCILNIIKRQTHATRIFVGDVYQKIYGFRHVNEPFEYIMSNTTAKSCECFQLSVSFRMGSKLMHYTNMYLKRMYNAKGFSSSKKNNDTDIKFFDKTDFYDINKVNQLPDKTVVLCRYNTNVQHLMFTIIEHGLEYDLYGKTINFDKEISIVRDLEHIETGTYEHVVREKLKTFRNIQQVLDHFTTINVGIWKDRIRLFNIHGGPELIRMWTRARLMKTNTPRIIITTAHQSKGSEFDHVVLYDDFPMNNEDAHNTLYVAMTRAKETLYMNESLAQFFKKMTKPVLYVNDTVSTPRKFQTCTLCNAMKTNLLVCAENDHRSIIEYGRCDLYEYVPICNICRRKQL